MVRQNYGKSCFNYILLLLVVSHVLLKSYERTRDLDRKSESVT